MRLKTIIGIILALASVCGMYLWETKFRDEIVYTKILVPRRDIEAMEVVSADDFTTQLVNPGALVKGALVPENINELDGKLCLYPLTCNQQIISSYFKNGTILQPEGFRNYVIHSSWIQSFSVYIDEGDYADFYSLPAKEYLGKYKIDILKDTDGGLLMEISAGLEDYYRIFDSCSINKNQLLITTEKQTWEM